MFEDDLILLLLKFDSLKDLESEESSLSLITCFEVCFWFYTGLLNFYDNIRLSWSLKNSESSLSLPYLSSPYSTIDGSSLTLVS